MSLATPKPDKNILKPENQSPKLDDHITRLILIPALGLIISFAFNLYQPYHIEDAWFWLGFPYFILLSFLIWQGNRFLLMKQRQHYNWFNYPIRKIAVLIFANIFYTSPITVLMIWLWYQTPGFDAANWDKIIQITILNTLAVIFITHIYETAFLIREREDDLLKVEKLERARTQAELDALKAQIDPHFIFNSLNTLSFLIGSDATVAKKFTKDLSDTYRYILMHKDDRLIVLVDEIKFLEKYLSLLKVRFGKALNINTKSDHPEKYLIPPISLQILLENVVKHNEFSENKPINVDLAVIQDQLLFSNPIIKKIEPVQSTKMGLNNLQERFKLVTGREIKIFKDNNIFQVALPLLPF